MRTIFFGLALVLLDADVTFGTATLDLLPDFIGFDLMRRGMEQLAGEETEFNRGRHWAFGMELAAVILYGARILRPDTHGRVTVWILNLILRCAFLILLYFIVRGTEKLCRRKGRESQAERMKGFYLMIAVLHPVCALISWIPLTGSVSKIASAVLSACFLAAYRSCIPKKIPKP